MPDARDLISPSGQPLIHEPNLIVIKHDRRTPLAEDFLKYISNITHCLVVAIPMEAELIRGSLAADTVDSTHIICHSVQDLPMINFTQLEIETIYAALQFMQSKGFSQDSSMEVQILKRIKKALPAKSDTATEL